MIEVQNNKCWFRTFSGRVIDPENLSPDNINSIDIARSLSLQCRYAGQICRFYSVAEHSLLVRDIILKSKGITHNTDIWLDNKVLLRALLHDASEAYISDIPTPFKRLLPGYYELEAKVMAVINERYGLEPSSYVDDMVKKADKAVLDYEMPYLFNQVNHSEHIKCHDSNTAFSLYLNALLQYE